MTKDLGPCQYQYKAGWACGLDYDNNVHNTHKLVNVGNPSNYGHDYVPKFVRPDWDEYFLGIAQAVAARADCRRRQIGAILVNSERRHRGSGYNGSRVGGNSCLAGECPRGLMTNDQVAPGSSYDTGAGVCHAIHAEQNVVADTDVVDRKDGTIYITDVPCDGCLRMLQGVGVIRIVWPNGEWRFSGDNGVIDDGFAPRNKWFKRENGGDWVSE